jgi:hypothetical protein
MGNYMERYFTKPETTPDYAVQPSFDANFGFAKGRKERGMCLHKKRAHLNRILTFIESIEDVYL